MRTRLFAASAVVLMVVSFGMSGIATPASAAVSNWQKGANMSPVNTTDFASANFQQSLRNLAATGANYVTLDIPIYQSNVGSTDIQAGWNTPTDSSLAQGIQFAHSLGLHVALKFNLFPYDGQWSAYINPGDRATWYTNYKNTVSHYLQIAQANGGEEAIIGTELIDMASGAVNPDNTTQWQSMIGAWRNVFTGKMTYDSNWGDSGFPDEKDQIQFWSSLDYIGISAYFNLSGDGSVGSLTSSWGSWDSSTITPLANKWGKQVLFTEVGYKSITDSYTHPWMWWEGGGADTNQQANDYQALFQYWNASPIMAGMMIWNWTTDPNAGGQGNIDYTPQNKPAQDTMKQWFTSAASTSTPPPPPPQGNPNFSETGSGNSAPPVGSASSFGVNVSNSGDAVSGINVDVEIYNSSNAQAFQQIFANQSFSSGGSQNYSVSFTPSSAGTYTLKTGVFSGDWTKLYNWNDQAFVFNAGGTGSGGGGPTSTASTINIWWPTDGSSISGVQPFKAMLTNAPITSYTMFWQVDHGQLNPMSENDTDYPHMEADVDVSPWAWNGSGPYNLNFVAQQGGQTVAQSAVNVTVAH